MTYQINGTIDPNSKFGYGIYNELKHPIQILLFYKIKWL